ncbi:MAG TPA: glutamate--tRNA ligase [Thermoguttaceae bacterium]|nr:glutamate--tRNA ligase [Thermoguttaceae bacterium]
MTVRTRFAPSPTGYLHIGGVRTALFCWLFARRSGGKFVLRIDDTDRQRNVDEALQPILHGLKWLGIDWDEGPEVDGPYGPYFQSQRSDRHQAAAEKLLADGFAYRDYATPEEIQAEREAAQKEGGSFAYSRRFMAETPEQEAQFEAEGRQAVVRLKMPRTGTLEINDLVRGSVQFDWAREQDHVIQRADGSCLYHLASVVDDHDMAITHVIRAEEHLSNTPRQIFIAQSLGYDLPEYAHLPYVAEPGSKNKLSKRKLDKYLKNRDFAKLVEHGRQIADAIGLETSPETFNPVIVDFYEQVGYLPEALNNYLALLGWSLDDKTEHFSREDLIEHFSLDRVNKSPSSFDCQKLSAFEDRHFQLLPVEQKVDRVLPFLQKAGLIEETVSDELRTKTARILEASGDRIKVAGDVLSYCDFFYRPDDQLVYDEKALQKRVQKPADAVGLLEKFRDRLAVAEPFDVETLDKLMHDFVEAEEIKIGQIIHAVRVATTGKAIGPGLFDCLAILGKEACLARIERTLAS